MEKNWKCTPSIDASSQVDFQGGILKANEEKGLFTEVDVKSPERQDIISDNAPPGCLNDGLRTRRDCA